MCIQIPIFLKGAKLKFFYNGFCSFAKVFIQTDYTKYKLHWKFEFIVSKHPWYQLELVINNNDSTVYKV